MTRKRKLIIWGLTLKGIEGVLAYYFITRGGWPVLIAMLSLDETYPPYGGTLGGPAIARLVSLIGDWKQLAAWMAGLVILGVILYIKGRLERRVGHGRLTR